MKPLLNDFTTAMLGGTEEAPAMRLPAEILSPGDASLLGQYETFLTREKLQRTVRCQACGDECETHCEPNRIAWFCGCRVLYFEGPVPVTTELVTLPDAKPDALIITGVIRPVPIAMADAWLLRQYKKFLEARGYKEALWCLRCDNNGDEPGMRAFVTTTRVELMCRCRRREYSGLTI